MNKVDKLIEWVAEIIYESKNKHSLRVPEAPPLPTWEQLKSGKGTLGDYNLRLVERYRGIAKQILSHPDLWLKIGEGEEEWVCDSEGVKHLVRIPITIPLSEAIMNETGL